MKNTVSRDFLTPEKAIEVARREVADFEFNSEESLAGYLPSLEVADIEYEITETTKDDGVIADWRSFNGQATTDKLGFGGKLRGGLQPLARNYTVDEYQKLKARRDSQDLLHTATADLVSRGARAIARAVNVQRANAMVNARVELYGPGGLAERVDFGRRAEFSTTAPKLWTDPTADPIEFLATICDAYEEENGFRPKEIRMPNKIKRLLFTHPIVVDEINGVGDNANRRRIQATEVRALLDEWDIPEIKQTTTATYKFNDYSDKGAEKTAYLFPQDSILLTAGEGDPGDPMANPYGRTFWGETVSAEIEEFAAATAEFGVPGIVAGVQKQISWPYNLEVIVDALAMPVVISPNYTLKAKVI